MFIRLKNAQDLGALACAIVFLDLLGVGVVFPLLPLCVESIGGTAETVGWLVAAFWITNLFAAPVLGRLSDRVGRRPVILASVSGYVLAMALFALAMTFQTLPLLFASRILAGITGVNVATCQAVVADVTPESDRTAWMGRIGAAIGLGFVLGPAIGSLLSGVTSSAPPFAAAAMGLLNLVVVYVALPETRAPGSSQNHARQRDASPSPVAKTQWTGAVVRVLLVHFLIFFCMANLQTAVPLLVKERLSWGAKEVGLLFALSGLLALVLQGALLGPLSRAFGSTKLAGAGAALTALGMGGLAAGHAAYAVMGSLGLLGIGLGIMVPALSSITPSVAGKGAVGTVIGLAQSAGGFARAAGPVVGGVLFARIGPGAPFAGSAAAALLSLVLLLRLKKMPL